MSAPDPDINAPSLLDPEDPAAYRRAAHAALDRALDFIDQRQAQPVWQPLPPEARRTDAPLPLEGVAIDRLVDELGSTLLPHTLGNTHPRFWGWVHGTGTPGNVIAQLLQGAINANMGGREHAPLYLERQVINWWRELFALPAQASGIICSGTSMATLLALTIARRRAVPAVRERGNPHGLRVYASAQSHVCVDKALEVMGLGRESLCRVPLRADFSMDTVALEGLIEADLARGAQPFVVVSTVGSVNTGALDDLQAINRLCRANGIWHHVDGAFGALAILSPALRERLRGISDADSIAFDFHKWLHVTYAAGCLLVADGELHRQTFTSAEAYLAGEQAGIAGGAPWPNDYGLELSRGFNALGVWMQMREQGVARLGRAIERNCLQAQALGEAVSAHAALELLAPVTLNVVCFRYRGPGLSEQGGNELNRRILLELQCRGIAAPSSTELDGRLAIRVAITNHRTRWRDLQALVDAVPALALELRESAQVEDSSSG